MYAYCKHLFASSLFLIWINIIYFISKGRFRIYVNLIWSSTKPMWNCLIRKYQRKRPTQSRWKLCWKYYHCSGILPIIQKHPLIKSCYALIEAESINEIYNIHTIIVFAVWPVSSRSVRSGSKTSMYLVWLLWKICNLPSISSEYVERRDC